MEPVSFEETVSFHGHACPGLAMGYRVACLAMEKLAVDRAKDEGLVAIVENNSCAVDAIQAVLGATFGKGNLVFRDLGKQVYTFVKRSTGQSLRVAVQWIGPAEDEDDREIWRRYFAGDRSAEVVAGVKQRKEKKMRAILAADAGALFSLSRPEIEPPDRATIYSTETCGHCGEKVMASRIVTDGNNVYCIPCSEKCKVR